MKEDFKLNQDLGFPVTKLNDDLLIEVYEKSTELNEQLIGSVLIPLSIFDQQILNKVWYQI